MWLDDLVGTRGRRKEKDHLYGSTRHEAPGLEEWAPPGARGVPTVARVLCIR